MAPSWLPSAPTLRLSPVSATPSGTHPGLPATPVAPAPSSAPTSAPGAVPSTSRRLTVARVREIALAPTTALVVMMLGLALLFVLPTIGLPFVAVVVLPTVVYHLRAEHRVRLRRTDR